MSEHFSHSFSHPQKRSKSSMSSIVDRDISPDRKVHRTIKNNFENAYSTTEHSNKSFDMRNHSLSVKDVIRSRSKQNLDFGIEGYWIRKYNPYFDKPRVRKWVKNKLPDFFSMIKKRAQNTPSPDHYQK
jgi:hypothetical protein